MEIDSPWRQLSYRWLWDKIADMYSVARAWIIIQCVSLYVRDKRCLYVKPQRKNLSIPAYVYVYVGHVPKCTRLSPSAAPLIVGVKGHAYNFERGTHNRVRRYYGRLLQTCTNSHVFMGTTRMRQQWCQGRFSSPPQKRPGNEAKNYDEFGPDGGNTRPEDARAVVAG